MSAARVTPARVAPPHRAAGVSSAVLRRAGVFLGTVVFILVVWQALLVVTGVSPFVAKSPADVWAFLWTDGEAALNRAQVLDGLLVTAHDAGIGYVAGLGGAAVIATLFALFPALSTAFMPVAMVLRTFPLVALTPLIVLAFGRGVAGLAAIGFIVVFFSALVTISFGIAGASRQALDVVAVFGGGRWAGVFKVGLPSALPAFFTAARLAIPQSLSAALIAEWLITGTGAGSQLMRAAGTSQYVALWSTAAVFIFATTIVYTLVTTLEELVLARFGGRETP
ncbi:ABC transporter permease subunit [Microbacterium betulae]|uniref:ABC transporter permease subunit n=1 Tax=Microbacterium betulae TaxID=2981139 RepID=A0AA97FFK5_9MICO|nr:ABC transporter permease subunit [Microbacterium sp. AB]WOF22120.1 ABC transporter permease subunit [Microbacterium sp. AB]